MTLFIDNYDSFTYNLVHLVGKLEKNFSVKRNDEVDAAALTADPPDRIVISPGPGRPENAGGVMEIVRSLGPSVPILGICLGHQAIAAAYGGRIVRGRIPIHGKVSSVVHFGGDLFSGVPSPFDAVRYHSLVAEEESLPGCLRVIARSEDGAIMAVEHAEHPVTGLQFHPESLLTGAGETIIRNWFERSSRQ